MKSYSLGRVAQYARYHYVSNMKHYFSMVATMVLVPVVFGVLSRSVETVEGICTALYLFSGFIFAMRTTFAMRDRGTKILECVVPISNEERMTFMFLNIAVVAPIVATLVPIVGMLIVAPFDYETFDLWGRVMDMLRNVYLQWPIYVVVQIIGSASLLLNLVARRNLVVVYVAAFLGTVTALTLIGRAGIEILINNDVQIEMLELNEEVSTALFIALPILFYLCCYWALRRRQMKW
ncbi:MAG: hypothetical protein E7146_04315 [Rikenellaceae bacterium]|nr:hypothetical protein [Rikenellaceae bacterium]